MTTDQRRRLLGAICEGLSTESAAVDAGLSLDAVLAVYDADPAFRTALDLACTTGEHFRRHMERLQEE